jgi:hypothetical protein
VKKARLQAAGYLRTIVISTSYSEPRLFHEDFTMNKTAIAGFPGIAMLLAATTHADHNSPNGAGWA